MVRKKPRTEKQLKRTAKRQFERAKAEYANKVTTVTDVKKILTSYHDHMINPRLEFLEEYVMYKRMRPWEKAYYRWLNCKAWFKARYRTIQRSVYARRWGKENSAALDRMSKGETIEND
tara:strand:+ start:717 stop:1073 length:357 start_codon:yes stop_codon:yes gene_type:complete